MRNPNSLCVLLVIRGDNAADGGEPVHRGGVGGFRIVLNPEQLGGELAGLRTADRVVVSLRPDRDRLDQAQAPRILDVRVAGTPGKGRQVQGDLEADARPQHDDQAVLRQEGHQHEDQVHLQRREGTHPPA